MNIASMHIYFRQYAQQMGMQNTRAIRPEQIDIVINTSIIDTVKSIIKQNVNLTNDRATMDGSKIGQINALKSLYKVIDVDATPINGRFTKDNENYFYVITSTIKNFTSDGEFDCLYLNKLSINYLNGDKRTQQFPIRIIDDSELENTLNDHILRPSFKSPVAVVHDDSVDIYISRCSSTGGLKFNLNPNIVKVSYIEKPAVVKYDSENGIESVDCNLPEHLHIDIVKHAVDLYRIAVNGSLYDSQSQAQPQSQAGAQNQA